MALLNRPGAEAGRIPEAPLTVASPPATAGGTPGETSTWPGLLTAVAGAGAAYGVHALLPAVPMLTASVVLGIAVAHVPRGRAFVRGAGRPGLSLAGRRLMRIGIVLLGLGLGLGQVAELGWATVAMVFGVVGATFFGTLWLGRRLGLRGDQPLLIATGYSICGASAIGAVSEVSGSDEEDVAASVALVTLCGTLAIAVLPLLQGPLGLGDAEFGRWVGASVHDVGQVVATAQTAGPAALGDAVLVKLMRVALLAPLVAAVAFAMRARRSGVRTAAGKRPAPVPLFVAGFLLAAGVRATGVLPSAVLEAAHRTQEGLLAAALFGLGTAVYLPTLARTGGRAALLGLSAWVVVAGVSYAGVLVTV